MSTTEATDAAESAASLFGGDDAASDLFASLGTDSSSQSVFDISPDTLFPGPADADVFPVENGQTADYNSWPEPSQYPSQESSSFQPAVNSSGGGYAPPATSGYAPPAPSTQVYTPSGNSYAPPEKRQHYEPQAYAPPAPATVQNTTLGAPFELKAPANAYASYAPPVPANPPAQPAYNPYAPPPTKQTYAVPPVAPATPSQSAYGPYSPLATTAATYTSPYSNATGNTSYVAQKVAVVPPPPAPAPVLNRPKPNAYDPPFPTARSTRRGVSSSAVRSSVYGAYSQPAPPPPLPAGGQFTSSGYALPPPPPGPASPGGPFPNTAAPNPPYHTPPASGAPIATPPPPRPLSSNYAPNGQAPHLNPRTSYDSVRKVEPANLQSDFDVPPFRSSSPSKSSRPQPSRSDSVSSQASGDASYFPPPPAGGQFGDVHRPSSPGSLSTRSSTISPDPYTNGSTGAPDRTASPASVYSLDSARNPPSLSANPYLPNAGTNRAPSPLRKTTTNSYDLPKPGLTTNGYNVEGAGLSPLTNGLHNSASQYLSGSKPAGVKPPSLARDRSASSGSIYSATASPEQPYPPQHGHGTQQRSETDYGSYTSRYNYNAPGDPSAYDHSASQEIIVKPAQATAYAPSPSLLGANDPLGRTASRAPVFSFGFGGKFLTCFHGASMNTGFDVALSSRNSTGIHIRQLNKIIPQSALEVSSATFPGPLFSDPGTPTTGLVRTTTVSTQTKAKKARLVKYLTDRAEEISQGIGYLHAGSTEGRQAEGKLVLVKLLKILVENDGRLSGTASIDSAVRAALVPKLDATSSESSDLSSTTAGFSSVADFARPMTDQSAIPYPAVPTSESNEAPIATSSLRPSALDKIQDFLLRGERRKAYHFALDEKLWAHAMVIASSIDRDAWKETVNEFLRTELGAKDSRSRGTTTLVPGVDTSQPPAINGREGLRVAYSLYSGQGSASVQELVPQNLLARATGRLQLPTVSHMTPMTPNFAAPALANNIPVESLADWADTAAMMISNPMTADTSAALTALGDQLLSHQWVEAAHACYLLSPQTSPVGGIGNPSARVVLLGSRSPQVWPSFYKDSDPVIFTETLEFALSLAPPIKGQDAFYGLPHLQAYRFIRAMALAELGELQLASRYCEAITASFSRGSPYFTGSLLDQLKALSDRIVGLDHSDKSTFWKSTPSLDTIGRFLEGRFTKLVTGDVDPGTPHEEHAKPVDPNSGPFSQYSTISSATSSTSPSPQPSLYNLNAQNPRSGSAMGQSGLKSQAPIDRASSAMDHVRRRPSPPAPRIASANASTTTFAQAPSFVQAYNNYSTNPYSPSMATPKPHTETPREEDEAGGQEVSWWGSSSYGNDSANQTPVAATFMQVDSGVSASSDGFISLMDDASYSVAPVAQTKRDQQAEDADEDDLGFGNSKPAPKKEGEEAESAATPAAAAPKRPDIQPNAAAASSGSWFGRFWRRSETTPGPVKASLGEETSFYYDKELKRWVNKKAGSDEAKPAAPPPPPPSRPQSASPGMSGPRAGGVATPPPRSASVADMSGPPPGKSAMRVRSTLAAPPETASLPSSPLRQSTMTSPSPPPGRDTPPLGRDTPPPGRPKSQASKRAIRSRYVDVFQQEGAA